jgi:hypothetical protein
MRRANKTNSLRYTFVQLAALVDEDATHFQQILDIALETKGPRAHTHARDFGCCIIYRYAIFLTDLNLHHLTH